MFWHKKCGENGAADPEMGYDANRYNTIRHIGNLPFNLLLRNPIRKHQKHENGCNIEIRQSARIPDKYNMYDECCKTVRALINRAISA